MTTTVATRSRQNQCKIPLPITMAWVYERLLEYYEQLVRYSGYKIQDQTYKGILEKVARWMCEPERKGSLILYGNCGNGKTTTLDAIAMVYERMNNYARDYQNIDAWRRTPQQLNFARRVQDITQWSKISMLEVGDIMLEKTTEFNRLRNQRMLLLDDVGTEPVEVKHYGSSKLPFSKIVETRYNLGLPMVITSNLDDAGFKRYGDRVADRITEMCDKITFTHESYRK